MMNLEKDLEKNSQNTENTKNLFSMNLTWTIIIYTILCVGTTIFLSPILGIIFTVISLISLGIYFYYFDKGKKFIKEKKENEKVSE